MAPNSVPTTVLLIYRFPSQLGLETGAELVQYAVQLGLVRPKMDQRKPNKRRGTQLSAS